jgi:short-subunit dehydrogenase
MSARQRFVRALVTGASSGIGEELARQLAGRGTHLVLVARSADKLSALADELRTGHGIDVELLTADLTDEDDLRLVEDRLRRSASPVDLLVNNAGVGQVGEFADLDVDGATRQVALNVVAPLRLTHAALPGLRERDGAVLNVSSIAANQPVPRMATYAATKAFLTSWSEALREELRGTGVHVTVLAPGFTRTAFIDAADAGAEASRIPSFIWSTAEEVARAGIEGVLKGRTVVTPGPLYALGAGVSQLTPTPLVRRVVGEVTRRMR